MSVYERKWANVYHSSPPFIYSWLLFEWKWCFWQCTAHTHTTHCNTAKHEIKREDKKKKSYEFRIQKGGNTNNRNTHKINLVCVCAFSDIIFAKYGPKYTGCVYRCCWFPCSLSLSNRYNVCTRFMFHWNSEEIYTITCNATLSIYCASIEKKALNAQGCTDFYDTILKKKWCKIRVSFESTIENSFDFQKKKNNSKETSINVRQTTDRSIGFTIFKEPSLMKQYAIHSNVCLSRNTEWENERMGSSKKYAERVYSVICAFITIVVVLLSIQCAYIVWIDDNNDAIGLHRCVLFAVILLLLFFLPFSVHIKCDIHKSMKFYGFYSWV